VRPEECLGGERQEVGGLHGHGARERVPVLLVGGIEPNPGPGWPPWSGAPGGPRARDMDTKDLRRLRIPCGSTAQMSPFNGA
jgi:hypothetical protein